LAADPAATVSPSGRFRSALRRVNEALDASPVPASEWAAVQRVLGADLLARLLGISTVSARRYASAPGESRTMSPPVCTRWC
jgi:hypothetical protein